LAAEKENLKIRSSNLYDLADELRELVLRHDPTQLIPSIAVPAAMSIGVPTGDDATQTFSVPAKIEYLVGLALTGPPGTADVPTEVTRKATELLASVFSAADAHLRLQMVSERSNAHPGVDQTSALLRGEHLFDRMAGYDVHLEEIGDAVFEPHRDLYCEELGFCPSDVIRLVRRHVAWNHTEFNTAGQEVFEMMHSDEDEVDRDKASDSLWRFKASMEAIYRWTPKILAESTGLPEQQIGAMLHAMSVDFGCQPDFRVPFDDNLARRYPLVRLPHDEYLAPDPRSLVHGIHEWLQSHLQANPTSRLANKYPRHRTNGAERLVHASFEGVFGKHNVFSNQHYDSSDGPGEIDTLVTGFTPLIAEVKSRGLTAQGRRGYRRRVRTVARDVVGKSA